jgi:hypothetical protein
MKIKIPYTLMVYTCSLATLITHAQGRVTFVPIQINPLRATIRSGNITQLSASDFKQGRISPVICSTLLDYCSGNLWATRMVCLLIFFKIIMVSRAPTLHRWVALYIQRPMAFTLLMVMIHNWLNTQIAGFMFPLLKSSRCIMNGATQIQPQRRRAMDGVFGAL